MQVFRIFVTAGPEHPDYTAGDTYDAICMVDESEIEQARQRATDRLAELGWASITFRNGVSLPSNPDTSGFNATMIDALRLAKELGVSLIVYPEAPSAA